MTATAATAPERLAGSELNALNRDEADRAAALLDEALDLPAAQRAEWQRALAAREPRLAAVVRGLLKAASSRSHSDRPETSELIARRIAGTAHAAEPTLEGRRFGPYRVTGLLGRGGMGSVWRAERADGLFEREVALKLVHPGLLSTTLHERFARERQILAALAHPHIARLLDAGVADDGQPYLALELVEGTPLNQYCDDQRLALRARLVLMMQVLQAVQHAHQNLVIHRDLKPANILVDAAGQVRLLDFGIAKLLHEEGSAADSELTRIGGSAMTPRYASPEQAAGQPAGTASDVYSLGVVLYELLCGHGPQRGSPAPPSQWAIDAQAAAQRGSDPRSLAAALRGDLDTIALKALKPDPTERYPTAESLCADLQRFLDGEPVHARPDSAAYRVRKFVGRHRAAVIGASAGAAVLVAAAAVSLWQADAARQAAAQATRESHRAQAVQGFLVEVFGANSLRQADPLRARQATAGQLLDEGAARATKTLKSNPDAQEAVLDVLADMYFQLEEFSQAARLRRERALALEAAHGSNDPRAAEAWLAYALDVANTKQRAQAAPAIERARAILDAIGDHDSEMRGVLAIESARLAQYESLPRMRQDADTALAQFQAQPQRWTNLYHALQIAARARYLGGDAEGACALHEQAVQLAVRNEPQAPTWLVTPRVQMAEAEIELKRFGAAESHLREALAIAQRMSGEASGSALQTQFKLGAMLHSSGRTAEGWALLTQAQTLAAQAGAKLSPDAQGALRRFVGGALIERGEFEPALVLLQAEAADLREHYPDSLPLARLLPLIAAAFTGLGRLDESRRALDESERLIRVVAGPSPAPMLLRRLRAEQQRLASATAAALTPSTLRALTVY
jgi:eukaryotic-like serine/threonine-protein kinase